MPDKVWVYVREGEESSERVLKLDVDVCDENGVVCVGMRGFTARTIDHDLVSHKAIGFSSPLARENYSLMTFEESWTEQALSTTDDASLHRVICFLSDAAHQRTAEQALHSLDPKLNVIFISRGQVYRQVGSSEYFIAVDDVESWSRALRAIAQDHGATDALLYLDAIEDRERVRDYSAIVSLLQALAKTHFTCPRLIFAGEYSNALERCYIDSWIGFGRSLKRALGGIRITVVGAASTEARRPISSVLPEWMSRLWAELRATVPEDAFYQDGQRQVCRIYPTARETAPGLVRRGGTYLITGGVGQLGLVFAKHLAKKYAANIILTGRSVLDNEKQLKLTAVEELGGRVWYAQADASDVSRMSEVLVEAVQQFGVIHGVIHAAGNFDSESVLTKSIHRVEQVLSPKINGTMAIDKWLDGKSVDFIAYCSSSSAILGDFGSCDYAVGNRFQMAYARYHGRSGGDDSLGRVLAMQWPLWREGGMVSREDDEDQQLYLQSSGQRALETEEGLMLFEQLLGERPTSQLIIVGNPERAHHWLGLTRNVAPMSSGPATSTIPTIRQEEALSTIRSVSDPLREKARHFIKKLFAQALKLPMDRIHTEVSMEEYGIDSVIVLQLTQELEKSFGELSKTLLFEYPSIDALVDHFFATKQEALWKIFQVEDHGNSNKNSESLDTSTSQSLAARSPAEESQGAQRLSRGLYPAKSKRNGTGYPGGEIAIIAMSGRFPKACSVEEYWENLKAGVDCVTEIPQKRWDCNGRFNKIQCRWGGFIEGIDEFDPLFFGIAPRDAELIDPQERLFLETAWNVLESAGYTRKRIQGEDAKVGVYVGSQYNQYSLLHSDLDSESAAAISKSGGIANRVSHFFGLSGPSIAIDTMCSSSTFAIHLACKDLLQGECRLAIVGGVNLSLHPKKYIGLGLAKLIGSDAQRRSFADGDGFIPAEAVGAVLLKRLDRALADGDSILAVIKGSATNHSGRSYTYGVPNLHAEMQLIEDGLRAARVDPRTISYVEASAGGSHLGDAIEVAALSKVFGKLTADRQFCAIGTMKSNIGNPEASSGITQLIKAVLQLRHAQLPPTIKAIPLNPEIDFRGTPFYLQQQVADWKRPRIKMAEKEQEFPRRALINSFGAGGSNVILIIEEYMGPVEVPSLAEKPVERRELLVFSAKSAERLRAVVQRVVQYMKDNESISVAELAYTLQLGREAMDFRLAIVGSDRKELIHSLELYLGTAPENSHRQASLPFYEGTVTKNSSWIKELTTGEVGNSMIRLVLAEPDLEKIALMWTQGVEIPWEHLHEGRKLRMLHLPTYPFERERYWLRDVENGISGPVTCLGVLADGVSAGNGSTQGNGLGSRREVNGAKQVTNVQRAGTLFPRTDLERTIAKVWEEVLGVTGIGIEDNFLDLGGTSLHGEQVIVRLRELFHVELQVRALLGAQPTVAALAVAVVSELAKFEESTALERHFESVTEHV